MRGWEPAGRRRTSMRTRLIRAGFIEVDRAAACLADPALIAYLPEPPAPDPAPEAGDGPGRPPDGISTGAGEGLIPALARCADPDLALLSLIRLCEACTAAGPTAAPAALLRSLLAVATAQAQNQAARSGEGDSAVDPVAQHVDRLLAVLGASQALGDFLVTHPAHLEALAPEHSFDAPGAPGVAEVVSGAVHRALTEEDGCCDPRPRERARAATYALRRAYRDRLLAIVADDVTSSEPIAYVPVVGERMTRLVDATLDAGLLIARAVVGPTANRVALAVIAMGKTGAQELNYISDVDVVYVVGPARDSGGEPLDEEELVRVGGEIATELARATSAGGDEPPLWPLDTGLRPEGKDGALVRTLASHIAYYERWASSWEFQALLKARACAGDAALGEAYEEAVAPFIWSASQRENFVEDARAMRRRVERESEPQGEDDRRIKLGPGGLRDVEFTVQLLQLVHGRGDARLHVRPTLEAIDALSAGGYVSRTAASALADCYRALRLMEHRAQLYRLRRTHDLPSRPENLRRMGRGIDRLELGEPEALVTVFKGLRRQVRALHEEIYYRPLLGAVASLSADEMRLSPEAARARLASVGYLDPDGALRHIQALTEGVSRRAAIQRQLLPVIIGWIGQGPDPDNGLLSFRRLSEAIGGSHWYLAMLRDSPVAAQRLCQVLSGARWTTERLAERPESIAWLDDDEELLARRPGLLCEEITHILRRRALTAPDEAGLERQAVEAVRAVVSVRNRELIRAALADSLDGVDPARTARILTDATDAVIGGALVVATGLVVAEREGAQAVAAGPDAAGHWPGGLAEHAVIAMGRFGGAELTYASDADVLFVHDPLPGCDPALAAQEAEAVASRTLRLLAGARPHPLTIDADLRPEGRRGPMSRSLASYAEYYQRWASVWERHALVRARACAGSEPLGRRFQELIAPLRWSPDGLSAVELREIRRLKARMETERLPRGTDPSRHLKLGPGGLSDVEWAAQILQLAHGAQVPGLRTTSTLRALEAAAQAGLLEVEDAGELASAWILATRVRAANVLGTGRDSGVRVDVLPSDQLGIRIVGRLIQMEPGRERDLEEIYRRTARHARAVAERIVFGSGQQKAGDAVVGGAATTAGRGAPGGAPPDQGIGGRAGQASLQAGAAAPAAPHRAGPPGMGARTANPSGAEPQRRGASPGAGAGNGAAQRGRAANGAHGGNLDQDAPVVGSRRRPGASTPPASRRRRPVRRRESGPYPWS